ncbi:MAG: PilZ domain-containing protein [Vicinamibacterales bacterium]
MSTTDHESHVPSGAGDRRRTPRTEVLGRVAVDVEHHPGQVRLREVSLGGFSLETDEALPAGRVHRVRFMMDGTGPVETLAECVHSTRLALPGAAPVNIAGFEFVSTGPVSALAVATLVEHVAALCEPA